MTDIVHDTVNLPDAFVGVAYEAALAYHGNATALTASSVTTGALPAGLALVGALPFSKITGTPTTPGTSTFKVTLTDTAGGVASPSFTITVRTTPSADLDDTAWTLAARMARHGFGG